MAVRLKDRIEANIRQSDKVNNSLSIQLNSGTATIYDGSAAKSINITPAAIGAAKASDLSKYLPLAGGTMTGAITRNSSTTAGTTSTIVGSATAATLFTLISAGATSGTDYNIIYTGRLKNRDSSTTYYYTAAKLYIDSYSFNVTSGARLSYYYRFHFPSAPAGLTASSNYYFPYKKTGFIGNSVTPIYVNGSGEILACEDFIGLVSVAAIEPTNDKYTLWVDTSEDAVAAMPADGIKYKAFTITSEEWTENENDYSYSMSAVGITETMAVLNLTLDEESLKYQKTQLNWETGANIVTLTTSTKPSGTLNGYLIAAEVAVI